jgi:IS1 transposase
LFNVKISEEKFNIAARALSEGTPIKGTARIAQVGRDTVRRIIERNGIHSKNFHRHNASNIKVASIEMDERHGFCETKKRQWWEAFSIDPKTKFIIDVQFGHRDKELIRALMAETRARIVFTNGILVMTDGLASYESLFPEFFGSGAGPPGARTCAKKEV